MNEAFVLNLNGICCTSKRPREAEQTSLCSRAGWERGRPSVMEELYWAGKRSGSGCIQWGAGIQTAAAVHNSNFEWFYF